MKTPDSETQRHDVGTIPPELQPLLDELQSLNQISDMPRRVTVYQSPLKLVGQATHPNIGARYTVSSRPGQGTEVLVILTIGDSSTTRQL